MKKQILLGVILSLLLSAAFPAFAWKEGDGTEINAQCNLPEILVTVPSSGQIYINPFQIPVEMEDGITTDTIIFAPIAVENESDVPLDVTMTVTGSVNPNSDLRLVSSSTKGEETNRKYVFLYCEIHASNSASEVIWDSEYDEESHMNVKDGRDVTKKNVITLDQADKPNRFGVFRLTGDCIMRPRDPWSEETDTINVKIAFTFTPQMRETP